MSAIGGCRSRANPRQFDPQRLEQVFGRCFSTDLNTRLQGGASEPLYQPAAGGEPMHVLYYREDYFASALHEAAHWCIAGAGRRAQVDFGYWYAPDGRCVEQQRAFEDVEYKPQALEWFFCKATGYRFRLSIDNLHNEGLVPDTSAFQQRVLGQTRHWQLAGLPTRAARFYRALCLEFDTDIPPAALTFATAELA